MTHTTKHAPGAWYAANMGNDFQGLVVEEQTGKTIAVAYDKRDVRILAAAPAMYEALKMARWLSNECECHESWNAPEGNLCGHCTADLAIKTALSQAEGK